jgi:hypothetical protein
MMMDDVASDTSGPGWHACPGCGESFRLDAVADAGTVLQCPYCSTRFVAPGGREADELEGAQATFTTDDDEGVVEPPYGDEHGPGDAGELDGLRVRQLSSLRRGAYRTRSHCIIAVAGLAFAAAQLVAMTARHVRLAGWGGRPVAYAAAAVAAAWGATFLFRKSAALTRELRRPVLSEPEVEPDFSTLSDGSQQLRHLRDM